MGQGVRETGRDAAERRGIRAQTNPFIGAHYAAGDLAGEWYGGVPRQYCQYHCWRSPTVPAKHSEEEQELGMPILVNQSCQAFHASIGSYEVGDAGGRHRLD